MYLQIHCEGIQSFEKEKVAPWGQKQHVGNGRIQQGGTEKEELEMANSPEELITGE